jgi:hypothetical protein
MQTLFVEDPLPPTHYFLLSYLVKEGGGAPSRESQESPSGVHADTDATRTRRGLSVGCTFTLNHRLTHPKRFLA